VAAVRESELLSIVVLGQFNPATFQPAWFANEGLLRPGEAEASEVEIIHRDVSIFTAGWVRVQVTHDRMHVQTERESDREALRDLATGTLSLLRHTPTNVVGVNHDATLRFRDRRHFDTFGWRLSPRELWEGALEQPGVAQLQEQGVRTDEFEGYVRVKVEPILDNSYRAVVGVNDHYVLSPRPETATTGRVADLLVTDWKQIASRAVKIINHMAELES
jgi:hypothetical protein